MQGLQQRRASRRNHCNFGLWLPLSCGLQSIEQDVHAPLGRPSIALTIVTSARGLAAAFRRQFLPRSRAESGDQVLSPARCLEPNPQDSLIYLYKAVSSVAGARRAGACAGWGGKRAADPAENSLALSYMPTGG